MFRCITTKKNKHIKIKIPMNMNIKNIGKKKKTVTHITNHISLIIGLRDIPLRSIT